LRRQVNSVVGTGLYLLGVTALALLFPIAPVQAACTPPGGTVVTCSGTTVSGGNGFGDGTQSNRTINVDPGASVNGGNDGLSLNSNNTVNNSGSIVGTGNAGIDVFGPLTVNNTSSGSISGGTYGIFAALTSINLTNAGTISGGAQYGIIANSGTINNSGTISVTANGISAINIMNDATITNSGTISGPRGIIAGGGGVFVLNNSGTIIGTNGSAIDFSTSLTFSNTLNFLPGSRIIGNIDLGSGDTVNIRSGHDIAWLLTFGACGCGGLVNTGSSAFVTGGAPYVINGDQIATLDPTAFGLTDRVLVDFTGFVSSLLANRFGEFGFNGTSASAFAPSVGGIADGADAAFSGALAYAADSKMPHATAVDRASGIAVWSKGFAGARWQGEDGPNLSARVTAYGGMIGIDKSFASDLRLGAFLGAGNGRVSVDRDSQTVKTDYAFGGFYGRYDWASQFLDFVVSAGRAANASDRLVANNLVPGGAETAVASYNSWFASPEIAYGMKLPMLDGFTLTPAARVRYVAGFFDGYSEANSGQNLSVASRTTQNIEERLELALSHSDPAPGQALKTTAKVGILGQERIGGSTVSAVLIGQNMSFTAPGSNAVAGLYAGIGIDYHISRAVSLFGALEATTMNDNSKSAVAQGGLRVMWQ
jgi:hypothetical protein